MNNSEKIVNKLNSISNKIENSIIRTSAGGVPHIVIDSKYSICYFKTRNVFKIWDNYGTPDNKKVLTTADINIVLETIKELRKKDKL